MKTVIVWNNPKLFSFQKLPYFIFFFKTAYPKGFYLPLIKERNSRLDYDQLTPIINHAKQDFMKRTLHVIVISELDVLTHASQNVLFNVCSILLDQTRHFTHVQILFLGFFNQDKLTRDPKIDEFEKLFITLVKSTPNASYRSLKGDAHGTKKPKFIFRTRYEIPQKCFQQTISAIAETK